ncbi:MAG: succinylglutamate desuccinylase/aspartoacylase family protein [Oscillospiraceae bacterium]|nr:succinylglutamate desuccinylase/aspartoacylase family protein [Oscillospiraceae bacterium]
MRKETIYSITSPYREPMDIIGYRFGSGERSLCIVGSMRGNEVQQMYVCSQLVQKFKRLEKEGKIALNHEILIIPCVNYYSMNIGKRFWTMDNTDINCMFPGYDMGETTQRIADGLFEEIQGYRYGIQFASFYQQGDFLSHVKMMETGFTDHNYMLDFGLPYAFIRIPRPYDTTTLNYNWQIWETKAFSLYTNATDQIDLPSAKIAIEAVLRFANKNGITTQKIPGGSLTEIISESELLQLHSTKAGIYRPYAETGDSFEKGDLLCEILDPLEGTVVERITAPSDGIVFFRYNRPLVFAEGVLYKIIRN